MTAREVIAKLNAEGWNELRQRGSHRIFGHPTKAGRVIVAMHRGDIPTGTLRNIFRQAGWQWPPA